MMDIPADLRELYFTFGVTAEKAQVMETAAGNAVLAYLVVFVDTGNITPEITEWFKQLLDDMNSKTFGTVLRTLEKAIQIDDKIIETLEEALQKRNYIMHEFYRHHNFAIHSEEGRRTMIGDLVAAGKKFDTAQTVLEGMASCLHQLSGTPADFGTDEAHRLEARGKRVNI